MFNFFLNEGEAILSDSLDLPDGQLLKKTLHSSKMIFQLPNLTYTAELA